MVVYEFSSLDPDLSLSIGWLAPQSISVSEIDPHVIVLLLSAKHFAEANSTSFQEQFCNNDDQCSIFCRY